MAAQEKEKKKGGLREALFGGSGTNGSLYRIIYLSIAMYMTDKGPEQFAILLYGDDEGTVYSNTLPAHSIMYNYHDDIDGPYIKLTKSFMPGSSKAEILLPKGYSFMAPSMPTVFANMPSVTVTQTIDSGEANDKYERPEGAMTTDDVIRMINESEQRAREAREANESTVDSAEATAQQADKTSSNVDNQNDKTIHDVKPDVKKKPTKHQHNISNVIPESDPFVASFDSDALTDKINKFMEKRDTKPVVESKPVKETDPRTIEEVKRESVEDEMERLMKNADQMRKIEEAANIDAAGGKEDKK